MQLVGILSEPFVWRWDWERFHPKAAFETAPDRMKSTCIDANGISIFETIFFYRHFLESREPLLYNTALLIIMSLARAWKVEDAVSLAQSTVSIQDRPMRPNPLALPHGALSLEEVSEESCRSVKYQLQGAHMSAGAMFLLLPLRILVTSSQGERRKSWLIGIMKRIAVLCGFRMLERLSNHSFRTTDM